MNTRSGTIHMPTGWPSLYEVRRTVLTLPMTRDHLIFTVLIIHQHYIQRAQTATVKEARFGLLKITETILNYPVYYGDESIQILLDACIFKLSRSEELEKYIKHLKRFSIQHRLKSKKVYIKAILDRSHFGPDITSHIVKFIV